ncbi:MAG: CCA tRNA nucleotidyltransferase [Peptococcaceae bacterium]|jgi:tRNA nucleotidyltransferase/poly(A) polymerase|nr:CCA tRNA nucleotidyltransferase [Peptococcaceae bacterium]
MNEFQEKVINVLVEHSPVWLVGGAVRDIILGSEAKDLDLVTSLNSDQLENILLEKGLNPQKIGAKFNTVSVFQHNNRIDIVQAEDLRQDALRRDFTINAMYLNPFTNQIFDPLQGSIDLEKKIIKTCNNPFSTFREDPVRVLRMVKYAVQYEMEIEQSTWEGAKDLIALLVGVSKERITAELAEILVLAQAEKAVKLLDELDYWEVFVPELARLKGLVQNQYHSLDVWEHTLAVFRNTPEDLFLRIAALFHDIGKWEVASRECYVAGTLSYDNNSYYIEGYKIIGTRGDKELDNKFKDLLGKEIKVLGARPDHYPNIVQFKRLLVGETATKGLTMVENGKRHFLNHERASTELLKNVLQRYSFAMFFEGEGRKREEELLYLVGKHMNATLTFMPELRGKKTKRSFRDRAAEFVWDICWDGRVCRLQRIHDFLMLWKADYGAGKVHTEQQNIIFEKIFRELLEIALWQYENIDNINWSIFREYANTLKLTGPGLGEFKNHVRKKALIEGQTDLDDIFLHKAYQEYIQTKEKR